MSTPEYEIIETTASEVRVEDEMLDRLLPLQWGLVTVADRARASVYIKTGVAEDKGWVSLPLDAYVLVRRPAPTPSPSEPDDDWKAASRAPEEDRRPSSGDDLMEALQKSLEAVRSRDSYEARRSDRSS